MRVTSTPFYNGLKDAPNKGIAPRWLVTFTGKTWPDANGNVEAERMSFWSDNDEVTIEVTSQLNNLPSTRKFYGSVGLKVEGLKRTSRIEVNTVTVKMYANAPAVEQLYRGLNMHRAVVEIWACLLDPRTSQLLGTEPEFLGMVDGAPESLDQISSGDMVEFNVVNDLMMALLRTNPAKSSHEEQKKRTDSAGNPDAMGKYAGAAASWKEPWGEE